MSAPTTTASASVCPRCQADLKILEAVRRTYLSRSPDHGDAYVLGHYREDGSFEPDGREGPPGPPLEEMLDSDQCDRCECWLSL